MSSTIRTWCCDTLQELLAASAMTAIAGFVAAEPSPLEAGGVLFSFETERELAHVKVERSESAVVTKHATLDERPHRASRPCRDKYTVPRTVLPKGQCL